MLKDKFHLPVLSVLSNYLPYESGLALYSYRILAQIERATFIGAIKKVYKENTDFEKSGFIRFYHSILQF